MRIRSYLIALVLATIAPVVVVIVALATWMVVGERAKEEAAMRRLAVATGGAVDAAIGQQLVMAQVMAAALALLEQSHRAALETLARRAAAATRIDVLAAGHDGVQVLNTRVPPGEPFDAQPRLDMPQRAVEGGRPILTYVQPGPRTSEPIAAILVPTHGPPGEDLLVAVQIEPEHLEAILPSPTRWREGFAALFDNTGKPVALAVGTAESAWQRRIEMGADHEPHLARSTEDGINAALAAVGSTGWTVAIGAPDTAVVGNLQTTVWIFVAVSAAGVLLAMAVSALLGCFLLQESKALVAATEGNPEHASALSESRVREVAVLRPARTAVGSAARNRVATMGRLRAAAEDTAVLEERITERTRELEKTTGLLLNAQDEERRRIARDIHDSTVQELIATSLVLVRAEAALDPKGRSQAGAALTEARGSLRRAEEELRTVSFILQPPLLDECGLATALQVYAEGFSERTGISVAVSAPDSRAEIQRTAETALFRVVQEALANVHRHSGAHTATIRLSVSAEGLFLRIEDNGRGMPVPGLDGRRAEGVGIPSMRARLRQLGGDLEIHSTSSGTLVAARLPMTHLAQGVGTIQSGALPGRR